MSFQVFPYIIFLLRDVIYFSKPYCFQQILFLAYSLFSSSKYVTNMLVGG